MEEVSASPPLVPLVVLPPEKSEGHEGQGQLFSVDDGEKAATHEGPLRVNKKHLNIDVSPLPCTPTEGISRSQDE